MRKIFQDVEPNVGMNGSYTQQTLTFTLEMLSCPWLDKLFTTRMSVMAMCHLQTEMQENIFILCQLFRNLLTNMLNEVNSSSFYIFLKIHPF